MGGKTVIRLLTPLALLIAWHSHVQAEPFMGIMNDDRLTAVKAAYPNASYRDLNPAWLQPHQRLVEITGEGIPGVLALKMEHELQGKQRLLNEIESKLASGVTPSAIEQMLQPHLRKSITKLESSPPADPWTVAEIRWSPSGPVPVNSAIGRYGKPDKDSINEQFQRAIEWKRRAITAYVGDGERIGLFIFGFTPYDLVCKERWMKGETCNPDVIDKENAEKRLKR
jgi:hypothetical protein